VLTAKRYQRLAKAGNNQHNRMPGVGPHNLTPRQAAIVEFLGEHFAKYQRFPTLREIAKAIGTHSPNGIVGHLERIAEKGAIRYAIGGAGGSDGTVELPGLSEAIAPAVAAVLNKILGRNQ